jgi:hypothetical protein
MKCLHKDVILAKNNKEHDLSNADKRRLTQLKTYTTYLTFHTNKRVIVKVIGE